VNWKKIRLGIFLSFLVLEILGYSACASQFFFEEEFNGTVLDAAKWAFKPEKGIRWCSDERNGFLPGTWVSLANSSCYCLKQPPPFGTVELVNGTARLSSDSEFLFPYFFTGPPYHKSPFPEKGDFRLEIRLRHDYIGGSGNGIYVRFWEDTSPHGANSPISRGSRIFYIWADKASSRMGLLENTLEYHDIPGLFMVYRLDYIDGKYSVFINDRLVAGPVTSRIRPNAIWVGNPIAVWWINSGENGWTSFSIDYINVRVPFEESISATETDGR
jgi:hypothetical protein